MSASSEHALKVKCPEGSLKRYSGDITGVAWKFLMK